jgi:acyl-CoA reductase-like NAD-dependent aldehyde dehydrogenase
MNTEATTTDASTQPEATTEAAKVFIVGELIEAAKRHFVQLAAPWSKLSQAEQERTLSRLADDVRAAVGKAVQAIASNERLTFRAEVESVQFNGASDIKAVLKLMGGPESHALADSAGGFVTVVIEDVQELLAIPDGATDGDPDNKVLFDERAG